MPVYARFTGHCLCTGVSPTLMLTLAHETGNRHSVGMSEKSSCCAVMNDIGTAPLQVVGYEGIFGCLAMFCVLLPIVQHTPGQDGSGLHEDSWETWHVGLGTLCHSLYT